MEIQFQRVAKNAAKDIANVATLPPVQVQQRLLIATLLIVCVNVHKLSLRVMSLERSVAI